MIVNVGRMNKRITIVQPSRIRDKAGCWSSQETPIRTCWASFSRKSAKELTRENADTAEEVVRFLIRTPLNCELTRKMVVHYAGASYEIEYVNDYGDNREFTELLCKRLSKGV